MISPQSGGLLRFTITYESIGFVKNARRVAFRGINRRLGHTAGVEASLAEAQSKRESIMKRVIPFCLLCTLLCFLLTASAREQGTRQPRIPNCGSWDLVFSPNPNGGAILSAAAAVSGSIEVWSVGYYVFNYWLPLIEHWDGTNWQVMASPNIQGANHYLYGVTAVAPDDAWAVGLYEPQGGGNRTLILHWDGTSWAIVPSPNPATYNGLYAVAAASSNDVWAVGYYYTKSAQQTLIEHWDGTSWSVVASPNVGSGWNVLRAVTVVPNSQTVWAVGYYYRSSDGLPSTLIERWDGTEWSVVPSPDGSTRENYLVGVSSTGPSDAWTVGYYNTPTGLYLSLSEHWDGNSWQIVPSPSLSSSLTALTAISCISAADVWAVGTYYGSGAQLTLAQHWDGNSWQVFDTPNPAGYINHAINEFNSVASVPGVGVWAVGDYEVRKPAMPSQTLTAFYCPAGGPTPTPTQTPTATASPTATATPTATSTPSLTPTPAPTASGTPAPTTSPRPSPTPRSSPSPRPRPSSAPRPNS
jgi:hypothetical protein